MADVPAVALRARIGLRASWDSRADVSVFTCWSCAGTITNYFHGLGKFIDPAGRETDFGGRAGVRHVAD